MLFQKGRILSWPERSGLDPEGEGGTAVFLVVVGRGWSVATALAARELGRGDFVEPRCVSLRGWVSRIGGFDARQGLDLGVAFPPRAFQQVGTLDESSAGLLS